MAHEAYENQKKGGNSTYLERRDQQQAQGQKIAPQMIFIFYFTKD
jgi:hypothetical protein